MKMKLFEGEDILYKAQHKGFAVDDATNKSVIIHGAIVNRLGDDLFADGYFELTDRVLFNLDDEGDRGRAYKFIDTMIEQLTEFRKNISTAVSSIKKKESDSTERLIKKLEFITTGRLDKMSQEEVNKLHMKGWKPSNACGVMEEWDRDLSNLPNK